MIEKVNKEIYNEDNMMNSKEISTFFCISLLTLQFFYSFFKFSFMNDLALFNLKCQLTFTL